jgi:L,D-transpeptidase YcbB
MNSRWILFFFIFPAQLSFAQVNPERLKQFIHSEELMKSTDITHKKEIVEYYTLTNYAFSWISEQNDYNRDILLKLLEDAGKAGLNRQDYQWKFIESFSSQPAILKTNDDSVIAEIKFSDAAIHFFSDFMKGNTKPALRYDGLNYTPSCNNIAQLLAECTSKNQLCLLDKWEPKMQEIILIRKKIEQLKGLTSSEFFKEEKIISAKVNHLNKPLLKKLYYLGISDFLELTSDKEIKEKVKEAQRQFNLLADGVLRSTILKELNVPVATRIEQLDLSINYYRWLYCLTREQTVIVVNIPAAYMKVYDQKGVKLEMRMVVGQPSTPTPTLSSRISEVILYPYWMVPRSIATKELLPAIKRNPGYVNANSFQIINSEGKVVDPHKIDWQSMTASNFPYIIRQSTGCDNALGLLKLDFYNPFSVYLHDTPFKNFFTFNKRYFSHGCMRMEKPMELGHMVLKNNSIAIDTLTEKGCIHNQSPIVVKADVKMPVVVWYNPAGTDSTGRVIFFEDVYKKFVSGRYQILLGK